MRCSRHPQVTTYIQCGECDAPVCVDCMVTGPVGIRCPNCARPGKRSGGGGSATSLFQVQPVSMLRAGGLGLLTGAALGWLMNVLMFIGAAVVGYLIGEVVIRAGGKRRGRMMEGIAGGCAAISALLWTVPWLAIITTGPIALIPWLATIVGPLYALAALVLAVLCAVGRVRYL